MLFSPLLYGSLTLLTTQGAAPRDPSGQRPALGAVQPERLELAGKPLGSFPHFLFTRTFNAGDPIRVAFDPKTHARLAKRVLDVFVVPHERLGLALSGHKLAAVAGAPLRVHLKEGGVVENTFLLDAGALPGTPRRDAQGVYQLGRGYDVLVDVDLDGGLGVEDVVDGVADEAGFYVVDDFVTFRGSGTLETGPYAVTEVLFDGGGAFSREDVYFPSAVGELGLLPLVVVSHGNGHDYRWYDHIGYHMASFGYVVMSHANNTGPGIETASTSTLRNTDLILERTEEIAGGALVGHIDGHRIVWLGHSRGGEGVVRAYRRLIEGTPIAQHFALADVRLVSSMAPTDFLGPGVSDMGAAPYHLWTAGADADVNGCANCDICQTFHLLERADGDRFSLSLHGVGHGDFHTTGSSVAQGPCLVGRPRTHAVMRGYFLPLVQHVLDGNPSCLDYLTRQYEEFRALGTPDPSLTENRCVVADTMYVPGPERARVVIDDFQSEPALERSSSGGAVLRSDGLAPFLAERRYDDANGGFTASEVDVMNGMTFAGPGDASAGLVLEWNATDEWLAFEVPAALRDLSAYRSLTFRAAQSTRDELTVAETGDLDFEVELIDAALRVSRLRISAYGGGVEEPYARGGCGQGNGWANEFETVRVPLADFRRDGRVLDLANVVAISFRFGPAHGSPAGRIGLDELIVTGD